MVHWDHSEAGKLSVLRVAAVIDMRGEILGFSKTT